MDTQRAQPLTAQPLDYAQPGAERARWSELWSYREPVLLRYPQITWRIALALAALYALTPVFEQGGYDARMLHAMGLTFLWWAFIARLVLDVLVTIYRGVESVQGGLPRDRDRP